MGRQHREPGGSGEDMCLHEGPKGHEATWARLGLRPCACFSQHLENQCMWLPSGTSPCVQVGSFVLEYLHGA